MNVISDVLHDRRVGSVNPIPIANALTKIDQIFKICCVKVSVSLKEIWIRLSNPLLSNDESLRNF